MVLFQLAIKSKDSAVVKQGFHEKRAADVGRVESYVFIRGSGSIFFRNL